MKKLLGALLLLISSIMVTAQDKYFAFPGAEGFGRYATGGRGGVVRHVTNLNDSGTGSLREALNGTAKKMIVFDVSGTIHLTSALHITSNTTIAGQSAPGDGICIADYPCDIKGNNVIVRYMRFRLGNKNITKNGADGWDGFGSLDCNNIIIDHCSVSWSADECLSMSGCRDITVQWCMVTQSMTYSGHTKGNHGYGGNWGGAGSSYHHNLMAHHGSRTPRLGPRPTTQLDERMDMRNNVMYNFGGNGCYGGEAMKVNIVNNYYKPGPATKSNSYEYRIAAPGIRTTEYVTNSDGSHNDYYPAWHIWGKYYVTGNYNTKHPELILDENQWNMGIYEQIDAGGNDGTYTAKTKDTIRITEPIPFVAVTTHSAEQAYEKVLKYAGASLHRDSYDTEMVNDAANGTAKVYADAYNNDGTKTGSKLAGGIINSQEDLKPAGAGSDWSAWPTLNSTAAPTDTDGDGMPDAWEDTHGLNKNDATDGTSYSEGSGYTNVEVYLNSLVEDITNAQNEGGVMVGETLPGESIPVTYTIANSTFQSEGSGAEVWNFADGLSITGANAAYSGGEDYNVSGIGNIANNTLYTIHIPEGISISSITITGFCNTASGTSKLAELNGKDITDKNYNFPNRNNGAKTYNITLATAATGTLTFKLSGGNRNRLSIVLHGVKAGEGVTPPTPSDPSTGGGGDDTESVTYIISAATTNAEKDATTYSFTSEDKTFTMTNSGNKGYGAGTTASETFKLSNNVLYTLSLPDGVSISKVKVTGYTNEDGQTGYVKEMNGVVYDESAGTFPARDQSGDGKNPPMSDVVFVLPTPATGSLSLKTYKQLAVKLELTAGSATGIATVKTVIPNDGVFYTLQGVRVDKPTKGIYIQNGKKVVIK